MRNLSIAERNEMIAKLVDSLVNKSDEWTFGGGSSFGFITHIPSRVKLYVSDVYSIRILEPKEVRFGFFQRRRLRKAYQQWLKLYGNKEIQEKQKISKNAILNRM